MFTGIIEEVGKVESLEHGRLTVRASGVLAGLKIGDSVAVNGACLSVVELDSRRFAVDLSPETVRRTNLEALDVGQGVNLERPVATTDRWGGHIVQGHIDATGVVRSLKPEGDSILMSLSAPRRLMPYIVEKGFIAVDGVSLSVSKRSASSFTIAVIPYTLEHTVLNERRIGDRVNLEVDIVAKYIESLLDRRGPTQPHPRKRE